MLTPSYRKWKLPISSGFSVRTLQAWRIRIAGPAFVQVGRAVRYRRRDLIAWIEANTVSPSRAGLVAAS
jgi:hypothetical protein